MKPLCTKHIGAPARGARSRWRRTHIAPTANRLSITGGREGRAVSSRGSRQQRVAWVAAAFVAGSFLLYEPGILSAAPRINSFSPVLPTKACKTFDGPGSTSVGHAVVAFPPNLPKFESAPASLSSDEAAELAWYEGDTRLNNGFLLLAPRGWRCSADLNNDGSWTFAVRSSTDRALNVTALGRWNNQAILTACPVFPTARAAARHITLNRSVCAPPRGAHVTLQNAHRAVVLERASGNAYVKRSVVLWYPKLRRVAREAAARTTCVLRPAQNAICSPILSAASTRQSRVLRSLTFG